MSSLLRNNRPDTCTLRSLPTPFSLALAALGTAAALVLSGCAAGFTGTSTTSAAITTPSIAGKAMGGPNPIVGATVYIYATGNSAGVSSGYGVGTPLQEAHQQGSSAHQDTDSGGGFYFDGGYNCPAGQFAYLVVSGGNTGGNAVNSNAALVAALGRCEDLYNNVSGTYTGYKGSNIYVNELTTIAAAYALGHFTTVTGSGTGSGMVVGIGSDASSNAAQVSGTSTGCVNGVGACTTTATAGLAHAFQNAANLVNVFNNSGLYTGANATLPGNSNAVVPQQLINAIGNTLVSCVNSTGGVAGDGTTVCGKIFSATTIGTSVPADTFSAMINLAANPTLNGSVTAVNNFLALALPASSVYQPAAVSSNNDLSLAINYPAAEGFAFPNSGAVDINDVYYVANTSASGTAPINIISLGSNGTLLGNSGTNSNMKLAMGLSVDALGNGYVGNGSASGNNALGVFTTSGGVPSAITVLSLTTSTLGSQGSGLLKVYATAVDKQNNLWAFGASNSGSFAFPMMMCPSGISATSNNCVGEPGSAGGASSTGALLAIDPNQNVWSGFTATLSVLENTGTVASPTYPTSIASADTTSVGPNPVLGIAFTGSASDPSAYITGYKTGTTGVQTINYTQSAVGVASLTAGTNQFGGSSGSSTVMSGAYGDAADGNGTIWVDDYNDKAIFQTTPGATTPASYKIIPCLGGSTTCSTIFTNSGKPTQVVIDSTGSVWVNDPVGSNVVQIIGSAAPTWPLLSLGKTGTP